MKFIFLLWITIRGTFDASVWATAVWCILGYFSNVLWLQCFAISIAIHLIWNWPFKEYTRVHTKEDCLIYMRRESMLVGFAMRADEVVAVGRIEGRVVGDDIGRSQGERHRSREVRLLPAVGCFIGKVGGGEQRSRRAP